MSGRVGLGLCFRLGLERPYDLHRVDLRQGVRPFPRDNLHRGYHNSNCIDIDEQYSHVLRYVEFVKSSERNVYN